jgi:predicted kinase
VATVPVPPDTPILIVTGAPGVGKTTTAEILASRSTRAVHLESDAFFRFIRSGHVEPWKPESHDQNRVVMQIVAEAAAGYATAGYRTIVDGIVIPGWFLEPLRDELNDAGFEVACAVLRAPLSICTVRVHDREGAALSDSGVLEQLWQSFADLGGFERNVLDLDGETADEAADMVEQRLADGLLAI